MKRRRDSRSGALIFSETPADKQKISELNRIKELEERVLSLEKMNKSLSSKLTRFIKKVNKNDIKRR